MHALDKQGDISGILCFMLEAAVLTYILEMIHERIYSKDNEQPVAPEN